MKLILFILVTTTFLFSSNLSTLYRFYEKQAYIKACDYGHKYLYKNKNHKNEKYLTLYGLSCLETNKIDRISVPMISLKKSKDARANASYFSTILLQKQFLFQALIDKKPLANLEVPRTNFIVSKIFFLFLEKKFTVKDGIYKFNDEVKKDTRYQLYIKESEESEIYMIIDIYKDDKFIQRYKY